MSKVLTMRLNDAESRMLSEILASEFCEAENCSEWFRLLLHREYNKRKRLGVPKAKEFSTAFRNGRAAGESGSPEKSVGFDSPDNSPAASISPLLSRKAGRDK